MNQVSGRVAEVVSIIPSIHWKLFLGLSRTPHGLLDMCTPAMAALLWLGGFPPASVVIVGLITAFSGYTAVYALNDLVDYRSTGKRLSSRRDRDEPFDVDQILIRHPVAQGALPFQERDGLVRCMGRHRLGRGVVAESLLCLAVPHLFNYGIALLQALARQPSEDHTFGHREGHGWTRRSVRR